ncbi:hypothetical protein [uncultured Paracoccus sp.]|uniref:hypothetical protein n=1 Tax=uncultured Paracoccus sp. TaxID=189685 RepID=UPI002635EE74|nr:hypothetical protein [uncultured Paracoccus sp.]
MAWSVMASVTVASAQSPDQMDDLFAELAQTEGEGWAAAESDILRAWSRSGSATADLLLKRGYAALDAGDTAAAIGHFTALTDHAPDFAAGWAARAEAFYLADQLGPAAADLARTLQLEPRHWPALTQLAAMLEQTGADRRALAAYRQSLEINPHQPEAEDGVARLTRAAEGLGI